MADDDIEPEGTANSEEAELDEARQGDGEDSEQPSAEEMRRRLDELQAGFSTERKQAGPPLEEGEEIGPDEEMPPTDQPE